ncbi:hypothetical protein AAG906_038423 [Vitis piasezkii]
MALQESLAKFKKQQEKCRLTLTSIATEARSPEPRKSNLDQHVKVVHLKLKPFVSGILGCAMRFPFKHVTDNHEETGCHVYTHEFDEQFRLRPKGGKKRKSPPIEALLRKNVTPPSQLDFILCQEPEYLSWLLF